MFTGSTTQSAEPAADVEQIPEATGPVSAVGGEAVEVPAFNDFNDRYSLAVRSVQRRDQFLVGTLEIGLIEGGTTNMVGLLGDPDIVGAIERGFSSLASYVAPLDAALLTDTGWTYPLDYLIPSSTPDVQRRRLLADEQVNLGTKTPGDTVQVTVVWPDTGTDKVTIDIPARARFIDVPVDAATR